MVPHLEIALLGEVGIGVQFRTVVVDVAEQEHPVGVRVLRRRDQTAERQCEQNKQLFHDDDPFRGPAAVFR